MNRCWIVAVLPLFAGLLVGCDARIERFEPNEVYALAVSRTRSIPTEAALADVSVAVERLFGTPDEPRWPANRFDDDSLGSLVDGERLRRAAGPVSSDQAGVNRGLYRKHCVQCHGLEGSGAGPAALIQSPYPRDFRHGVFKWKSTERASKPTRDDLRDVLDRGVPGTGMPSFSLIPAEDIEALVDYVIYLSMRGEVERRLVAAAVDELGYDDARPNERDWVLAVDDVAGEASGAAVSEADEVVREIVGRVAASWQDAEASVVPVNEPEELSGPALAAAIERGRQLFHGQIANCAGCHGAGGDATAVTLDFDDWAKEYSTGIGLTPTNREAMRPLRQAGALPPRPVEPRDLSDGVFRGGGDRQTLYRRISQGIAGTPMPAIEISSDGSVTGLSREQAWDLIRYVRFLGSES